MNPEPVKRGHVTHRIAILKPDEHFTADPEVTPQTVRALVSYARKNHPGRAFRTFTTRWGTRVWRIA